MTNTVELTRNADRITFTIAKGSHSATVKNSKGETWEEALESARAAIRALISDGWKLVSAC